MCKNTTFLVPGIVLALALSAVAEPGQIYLIGWDEATMSASESSFSSGGSALRIVNGSGITNGIYHSTDSADMWQSARGDVVGAWIQFDLGEVYSLASAQIWNWNKTSKLGQGMQNVDVLVSINGLAWTAYEENYVFEQANGLATYEGFSFDFGDTDAQFVKIEVKSNYGTNYVGLSEIRFYENPEPATVFLLGLGCLVLLRKHRV